MVRAGGAVGGVGAWQRGPQTWSRWAEAGERWRFRPTARRRDWSVGARLQWGGLRGRGRRGSKDTLGGALISNWLQIWLLPDAPFWVDY